ncbi:hypothetical protein RUND412_001905 [Rhizina undulata]
MEPDNNRVSAEHQPESRLKKRKYEEATLGEKYKLYLHATQNPHLKQRELAEWFEETFHKAINQSTVSRNLKKFKTSPPPPIKEISGSSPSAIFSTSPIHPYGAAAKKEVVDDPTSMGIDDKAPMRDKSYEDELKKRLHSWYIQAKSQAGQQNAKIENSRILEKAKELHAELNIMEGARDFSGKWLRDWKVLYRIPLDGMDGMEKEVQDFTIGRDSIENEESSNVDKSTTSDSEQSTEADEQKAFRQKGIEESDDKQKKKEIKRLKKDIQKRDIQIEKAKSRRNSSLQKLEELEKELKSSVIKG